MRLLSRYAFLAASIVVSVSLFSFYIASNIQKSATNERAVLTSNHMRNYYGSHAKSRNTTIQFSENELISNYGNNDMKQPGELGVAVEISESERKLVAQALHSYRLNIYASDKIPLNRLVPDSRPASCKAVKYKRNLPTTSVVIPFFNEWPSILLRTVYSIINRTPRYLLKEIILVDDASDLEGLKEDLDVYIHGYFPPGLVKLIRLPQRSGLIRARLLGFQHVTGEVVSFFDSHMEVNIDWLQPLLTEVLKNRSTVAMGHLDYINAKTLAYQFTEGYRTRYGFDWRLIFFETFFRSDQKRGKSEVDPLPGVVMVGPAFVVDVQYFKEIGMYDDGMKIWGGENIEFAWRVWLCGGRLLHLPCSKIGHIARPQPYKFPDGRMETEMYNYKRAVDVWMGEYKRFVYDYYPAMKTMDVGDLSKRMAIKEKLHCKPFRWFIDNVWVDLNIHDENALAWGRVKNLGVGLCLDNDNYLFQAPEEFYVKDCRQSFDKQAFSLTTKKQLRTTLQCVYALPEHMEIVPRLQNCIEGGPTTWEHDKNKWLRRTDSDLCLDVSANTRLILSKCDPSKSSQKWTFSSYRDTGHSGNSS